MHKSKQNRYSKDISLAPLWTDYNWLQEWTLAVSSDNIQIRKQILCGMRGKAHNHLPFLFGKYEDHVSQFCRSTLAEKNMKKKKQFLNATLLRLTSNRVNNLLPSTTLAQREAHLYRNCQREEIPRNIFSNLITDACLHYKISFLQSSFLYLHRAISSAKITQNEYKNAYKKGTLHGSLVKQEWKNDPG